MQSAWRVAVNFQFLANPAGMAGVIGQVNAAKAAMTGLSAQAAAMSSATRMMVGGLVAGLGVGTLAIVKSAVDEAAKLQTAILGLQIKAGNASSGQKLDLANLLPKLAHETGIFNQTTAAAMVGSILGTGFTAEQVLAKAPGGSGDTIADIFAKFADARFRLTDSRETAAVSVPAAAGMAHQFAAYTPQEVGPMLESINRLATSFEIPLAQLARQTAYFAPGVVQNKIAWGDVVSMLNILGPMSMMSSKGGTGVYQVIQDLTKAPKLTRSLTNTRNEGMVGLGLWDSHLNSKFTDAAGKFNLGGALAKLAQDKDTMKPATFMQLLTNAFPSANALRTIEALVDPARRVQAGKLLAKESGVASISEIQARFLNALGPAGGQLRTDFASLLSRMITPQFLDVLTKAVQFADRLTTSLTNLFVNVPWTATATALGLVAVGVGLLFAGTSLLIGPLVGVAAAAVAFVTPVLGIVAAVVAAGAALGGLVWAFQMFQNHPAALGAALGNLFVLFTTKFIPTIASFGATIGRIFSAMFTSIGNGLGVLAAYVASGAWARRESFLAWTGEAGGSPTALALHKAMNDNVWRQDQVSAAALKARGGNPLLDPYGMPYNMKGTVPLKFGMDAALHQLHKPTPAAAVHVLTRQGEVDAGAGLDALANQIRDFYQKKFTPTHVNQYQDLNKLVLDAVRAGSPAIVDAFAALMTSLHAAVPNLPRNVVAPGSARPAASGSPASAGGNTTHTHNHTGDVHIAVSGAASPSATATEVTRRLRLEYRKHQSLQPSGSH